MVGNENHCGSVGTPICLGYSGSWKYQHIGSLYWSGCEAPVLWYCRVSVDVGTACLMGLCCKSLGVREHEVWKLQQYLMRFLSMWLDWNWTLLLSWVSEFTVVVRASGLKVADLKSLRLASLLGVLGIDTRGMA